VKRSAERGVEEGAGREYKGRVWRLLEGRKRLCRRDDHVAADTIGWLSAVAGVKLGSSS
jgi:hypothetical protein